MSLRCPVPFLLLNMPWLLEHFVRPIWDWIEHSSGRFSSFDSNPICFRWQISAPFQFVRSSLTVRQLMSKSTAALYLTRIYSFIGRKNDLITVSLHFFTELQNKLTLRWFFCDSLEWNRALSQCSPVVSAWRRAQNVCLIGKERKKSKWKEKTIKHRSLSKWSTE